LCRLMRLSQGDEGTRYCDVVAAMNPCAAFMQFIARLAMSKHIGVEYLQPSAPEERKTGPRCPNSLLEDVARCCGWPRQLENAFQKSHHVYEVFDRILRPDEPEIDEPFGGRADRSRAAPRPIDGFWILIPGVCAPLSPISSADMRDSILRKQRRIAISSTSCRNNIIYAGNREINFDLLNGARSRRANRSSSALIWIRFVRFSSNCA